MSEEVERWCAASLRLALGDEGPALIRRGRPWLEAVVDDVDTPPPLGIVLDVGRLLLGERLATWSGASTGRQLDRVLQDYAEHLVGRLIQDPHLEAAASAVLRLPEARRRDAIATIVDKLARRLDMPFPVLPRASLRHLLSQPEEELWALGDVALDDPDIARALAEQIGDLAHQARRTGRLLREADVFVLENLDALQSPSQQLALEQISEAAEAIERGLPRRIRPRVKRIGTHRTKLDDEGTYPTGGYASVASHGSLANLVPTELAYSDDGAAVDLFDLRFATNELLKYTRDESVFHRRKRSVVIRASEALADARVRAPELPWQRIIAAMGMVVTIVRRLYAHSEDDLRVELVIPPALHDERGLIEMLLRDWLELGTLEIGEATLGEAADEDLVFVEIDARSELTGLRSWTDETHRVLRELL